MVPEPVHWKFPEMLPFCVTVNPLTAGQGMKIFCT